MTRKPARRLSDLSPAQLQLLVVELQRKLAAAPAAKPAEPLAIVGLAGRYPGTDGTLDTFWDMMAERRCAIRTAGAGGPRRLNAGAQDRIVDGGYLDGIELFDAESFGVSDAEARQMDPQQRLLLETCWEAMERAGLAGDRRIRNTGVFLGICTNDFVDMLTGSGEHWHGHLALGNSHGLIAGRISRQFGLTGPSAAYNSACASSLVAAYDACRALQRGDCDAALVCGVNAVITDVVNRDLAALSIISRTGRCRPFDAEADGYVRGEGCGALVLRRLSDAKTAGDRVLAVIRGLAMTHDGSGQQMTPSRTAQVRTMKAALTEAGATPDEVGYVEAGSIGAPLADAVEGAALAQVYGTGRKVPLRIGTLKPLIGHLEGAAGVAALTRAAMSLSRGAWLPHGGLETHNPHMDWCDGALVTETGPVQPDEGARLAAVNSASLSGTNVNLILAAAEAPPAPGPWAGAPVPLLLSARTEAGLTALARACADRIAADPGCLRDLAATFAFARSRLPVRAACVLDTPDEARAHLGALLMREAPARPPRLAYVFGDDPPGAPATSKAATIEAEALATWSDLGGAPDAPEARRLARSMATTAHLQALGLQPAATAGHPLAAAQAAGVLTVGDAMRLLQAHLTGAPAPAITPGRAACPIHGLGTTGPLTAAALLSALDNGASAPALPEDHVTLGIGLPGAVTLTAAGGWAPALADLFVAGLPVDGAVVAQAIGGRLTDAPIAGFARRPYWPDMQTPEPTVPAQPVPRRDPAEARLILMDILRDELGIRDFDDRTDLTTIGASSLEVMRAMSRIEEELGFRPDIDLFVATPTPGGLLSQYEAAGPAPAGPPRVTEPEYEEGWI